MIWLVLGLTFSSVFGQEQIIMDKCPFREILGTGKIQPHTLTGTQQRIYNIPSTWITTSMKNYSSTPTEINLIIKYMELNRQDNEIRKEQTDTRHSQQASHKCSFLNSEVHFWIEEPQYYSNRQNCSIKCTTRKNYNTQRSTIFAKKKNSIIFTKPSSAISHKKLYYNKGHGNKPANGGDHDDSIHTLTTGGILSTIVMIVASKFL